MKEADFWQIVKRGMKPFGPHLCRIENLMGSGIPDVNGCYVGTEFWLELKIMHGEFVTVGEWQVPWHTLRWQSGGKSYILGLHKTGRIYLWPGRVAKSLRDHEPTPSIFLMDKPYDWGKLLDVIMKYKF